MNVGNESVAQPVSILAFPPFEPRFEFWRTGIGIELVDGLEKERLGFRTNVGGINISEEAEE